MGKLNKNRWERLQSDFILNNMTYIVYTTYGNMLPLKKKIYIHLTDRHIFTLKTWGVNGYK